MSSRHFYAGCRTVSKQVASVLIPVISQATGFDIIYYLISTPHQWFTCVRLLATHLTYQVRLFPERSRPRLFTSITPGRFAIISCKTKAEDLPPSSGKHDLTYVDLQDTLAKRDNKSESRSTKGKTIKKEEFIPHTRQLKVRKSYYPPQHENFRFHRESYRPPIPVPWINFKGYWLTKAGFEINSQLKVEVRKHRIVITLDPIS